MMQRSPPLSGRATAWLLGLGLLLAGLPAAAQQDPPGRVGSLNFQQGTVSFSPAGENEWFELSPNRPLTAGDRLWTDHHARAELHVGADTLRLDEQTGITLSELDDDTARITASQGGLQLRVREELGGRRLEVETPNLAVVVEGSGDYRIETDPSADTTRVAVAAGRVTLFGEGGESMVLGAQQQFITSGRNLAAASGAPVRADNGFDRWVAERDRVEEQSISARYVSREVVGYQQLDAYGDWQNDPTYGNVWYPRNVDAEWAPYRDGQWVDVAPWGWTWIDAAPWGFAPAHYGRWARIGPRWGWVPGQRHVRPVYAPALVGFVGGAAGGANLAIGSGRHGVGWFPLAPGEPWRPGYRASQRYVDAANRAAFQRQLAARRGGFANQQLPGAVTVVPTDVFGRGPVGRRDVVRLPANQLSGVPVGMGAPIPLGDHGRGGFGRPAAPPPPQSAMPLRQFHQGQAQPAQQLQQAQQIQQMQQQQLLQQRAAQAQAAQAAQQMQQAQQLQQAQRLQQAQQMQQAQRQQIEAQQRAAQAAPAQAQQQLQLQQQAQRQQQEAQQRAAQAQAQQLQAMQQLQQAQQMQQAQRQQIEAQQRATQAAQAQQQLQLQQQAQRQQQEAQQRAAQAQAQQLQAMQQMQAQRAQQLMQSQQQMLQAQQAQQANAVRQAQEMQQQRALQMQQRGPQRSGIPVPDRPGAPQPDRP